MVKLSPRVTLIHKGRALPPEWMHIVLQKCSWYYATRVPLLPQDDGYSVIEPPVELISHAIYTTILRQQRRVVSVMASSNPYDDCSVQLPVTRTWSREWLMRSALQRGEEPASLPAVPAHVKWSSPVYSRHVSSSSYTAHDSILATCAWVTLAL